MFVVIFNTRYVVKMSQDYITFVIKMIGIGCIVFAVDINTK